MLPYIDKQIEKQTHDFIEKKQKSFDGKGTRIRRFIFTVNYRMV